MQLKLNWNSLKGLFKIWNHKQYTSDSVKLQGFWVGKTDGAFGL